MAWYAFSGYNNGQAIDASAFDGAELNALGMHGYPTQAEAQAKPNSVSIFEAPVVNAAIDDYNNARDISPTVADNPSDITAAGAAAGNTAVNAAKDAAKAAAGSGWNLTFGNTTGLLGRTIKVALGAALLIMGIARMTGAGTAIKNAAGSIPAGMYPGL